MIGWNVYLDGKWIEKVFYTADCDKDYVVNSLIKHDGYPSNITVRKG